MAHFDCVYSSVRRHKLCTSALERSLVGEPVFRKSNLASTDSVVIQLLRDFLLNAVNSGIRE
jgi:hypothetical protein